MAASTYSPEQAVEGAWNVLGRLFHDRTAKLDPEQLKLGRIAASTVQAWSRIKATESAIDALAVMVARERASDNGAEFEKHLMRRERALPAGRRRT